MSSGIQILHDEGKGRAFICLVDSSESYGELVRELVGPLSEKGRVSKKGRVILLECQKVDDSSWRQLSEDLRELLAQLKVRSASFLGAGAACTLLQNAYLENPKLVRTLCFLDSSTRPHPSVWMRLIDWTERRLPLGLPFRFRTEGFDVKPFLQRIRCPVLVVESWKANSYISSELRQFENRLPNSWYFLLEKKEGLLEFSSVLSEFQDLPAKRPQKNVRAQIQERESVGAS